MYIFVIFQAGVGGGAVPPLDPRMKYKNGQFHTYHIYMHRKIHQIKKIQPIRHELSADAQADLSLCQAHTYCFVCSSHGSFLNSIKSVFNYYCQMKIPNYMD